ncbi:MAG: D-alanyl-D-alanine carboxypeptidase/D-alanyl-D-alanine-endopeptidase [Gemmatimonadota bacterium]|nr:D-alanyl-D-alanine carboxypeptidase/D-alanyl-D-alanine-endopeptidase [Gemmatimonadota bacterium]
MTRVLATPRPIVGRSRQPWGMAVLLGALTLPACARTTPSPVATAQPAMPAAAPVPVPAAPVPAPTTAMVLQGIVDSVLAAPMWRNARWGMLIVDAERGDTIVSHDADRLFMPASNQKLLTAAIAAQTLGVDYRWRTPVLLHGRQRGQTWRGDVLVQGAGDPSVSDSLQGGNALNAFLPIREALAARGITRITGRVRAVGDAFSGATTGYGWAYDDFDAAYSAAVDELMFNEGELLLTARAGRRAGAPVTVVTSPTRAYPQLLVQAVTRDSGAVPAGASRPARLQAAYDSIGDRVVVTGTLAAGDSASLLIAYRHPNDAYVAALTQSLTDGGIRVDGRVVARGDTIRRAVDSLTVLMSAPFPDVLRRMQKPSQNQIAELFFRTTGLAASGVGTADSARAVGTRTLAQWGITTTDAAYRDGSGLSRHDYLTPRAVISVLDAMRRAPWFATYRDALPVAGVDGTIRSRMKGSAAQGNARAKTGTLDKTRSLSGYVTTADGRLVLFSLLSNNFSVPTREVERVQDLLVTTLAARALGTARPQATR